VQRLADFGVVRVEEMLVKVDLDEWHVRVFLR
jgi:hypothetical protein